MKKIYYLIFLISNLIFSQTVATSLQVQDTRDTNSPPSGYLKEVRAEFKSRTAIGVPGDGDYSTNLTFAPWFDNSAGNNHQLNFNNDGIYYRSGLPGSWWNSWNKLILENFEGKVSIGKGNTNWEKLILNGLHENTTFLMHADNTTSAHAYLSMWASEPGVSYNGVGIGNNMRNYFNGQSFTRINTSAGGSYIRLLDNEINFNAVSASGTKKQVMTISSNAATVSGDINSIEGALLSSRSTNEGGSLTLINPTKTGSQYNTWILYNMNNAYGSSLQFWNYSADGTKSSSRLKLSDDGDMAVFGKFEAKEVKVTTTPTADFVFAEDYNLPKLEDVEKHIKENKHLPEIASAKEMEKEGVNVGEFQIKLLQKIEELTLYSIEQNKNLKEQAERIKKLEEQLSIKK